MNTTTILIKRKTKKELKDIGAKGQTYDQLITELIKLKKDSAIQSKTVVE
jgi:hypothetical protein